MLRSAAWRLCGCKELANVYSECVLSTYIHTSKYTDTGNALCSYVTQQVSGECIYIHTYTSTYIHIHHIHIHIHIHNTYIHTYTLHRLTRKKLKTHSLMLSLYGSTLTILDSVKGLRTFDLREHLIRMYAYVYAYVYVYVCVECMSL